MRPAMDAALATVREALKSVAFAEAFAAGQQMALEEGFTTLRELADTNVIGPIDTPGNRGQSATARDKVDPHVSAT